MRRALLLAAVAVPVIVLAAIPAQNGQLLDFNNFSNAPEWQPNGASFINADMCAGRASPQLEWNLGQTPPTNSQNYQLYASNKQPAAPSGSTVVQCATQDDTAVPPTKAGQIGSGTQTTAVARNTSVSGNTAVTKAGLTCDGNSELRPFFICAHQLTGSTVTSTAIGQFVVQVNAPTSPKLNSVSPGNGRVTASWDVPSGGATADHYIIQATPVGGGTTISSGNVTATSGDVSGLDNTTTYSVTVIAVSIGGNPSAPSNALEAAPQPTAGFWEVYQNRGGEDGGGCASGPGGVLALLGTASFLALRRRRS
jgi:fibronectin type III domain protein